MGEMANMQPKRDNRNRQAETPRRTVSLDTPEGDTIDLKLLEAIERLERAQQKALTALGAILSAS
ncbi:MAG: hypothetical protein ABR548_00680 [Actinomycetota bacterium]|nr:hypothetical protein [Actinomycetota bacterium]